MTDIFDFNVFLEEAPILGTKNCKVQKAQEFGLY